MALFSCRGHGLSIFPRGLGHDLKQVDISHNFIANLTDGNTASLRRLELLDLSSNQLQSVSKRALKHLRHLRSLLLATNNLNRNYLTNGKAFLSLMSLEVLDLSANHLDSKMATAYLHNLPSLAKLDLAGNQMDGLPRTIFHGVPALKEINLQANFIMAIEDGSFEPLKSLHVLNLAFNSLCCISGFNLPPLRVLNLSCNSLKTFVAEGAAGESYQLRVLDLSHNQLTSLPLLPRKNRLAHLNLSHNAIVDWTTDSTGPGEFSSQKPNVSRSITFQLATLENLDLSSNRMNSFPAQFFHHLSSMHTLSMAMNCLHDVAPDLPAGCLLPAPDGHELGPLKELTLLSVRKLDLHGNSIQSLPSCFFYSLPNLEAMDLALNEIQFCTATEREPRSAEGGNCTDFHSIRQLRHLSLRGNRLATVASSVFSQTPLSSLDLSENKGLFLPEGALEGLQSSLQKLSLRGSQMETSDMNFPCLGVLRILDLSENQLSTLPRGLLCSPLEKLDLQNNKLLSLEEAAVVNLSRSLRNLSIAGNPFDCCKSSWLQIMEVLGIAVLDLEEAFCTYQAGNKTLTVQISNTFPRLCSRGTHSGFVAVMVVVACCFLCMTCGMYYLLKRGKKHIPLYLRFINKVGPVVYLNKEKTIGQGPTDTITKV